MAINKIEHYDKLRYRAMTTVMTGWIFMQFLSIPVDLIGPKAVTIAMSLLGVVAAGVMAFGIFKLLRVSKQIASDRELREALNDELYISNSLKTFRYGFMGFIAICALVLIVPMIHPVSGIVGARIVLFGGITTFFVSWLVLNKRERYAGE